MSRLLRLDKFLTELNIGTRSQVKAMIGKGRINVNGKAAKKSEQKVDPDKDVVCMDHAPLVYAEYEYYMLNKPAGCVSATRDNLHRTAVDLIEESVRNDLFPVGRLDIDTEGLLLITNDGALAHNLLSPKKHIAKTYFARIEGKVTTEDKKAFAEGVDIGEKSLTKPALLHILSSDEISKIEITITEGKFHQIKRMFETRGKNVLYLKRIRMGALRLDETLETGAYRRLTDAELTMIKEQVG